MADDQLWTVRQAPEGFATGGLVKGGGVVILTGGCVISPSRLREIVPNPFEEEDVD